MMCRPIFWKNLAISKPFHFKSTGISYKRSLRIATPLLNVNILEGFHPHNWTKKANKTFLVLHYPFSLPALRSTIINTARQTFIQTLDAYSAKLPPNSCFRVILLPPCQLVPQAELEDHLTKVIQQFLCLEPNRTANTKLPEGVEGIQACLFPWNAGLWRQALTRNSNLAGYSSVSFLKGEQLYSAQNIRPIWMISHFYQISNSKEPTLVHEDLSKMLAVLRKFDFFQFFSEDAINGLWRRKSKALSLRLIRHFQWKTVQSQNYLVYLVKSFGPSNMAYALEDFMAVSQTFKKQ